MSYSSDPETNEDLGLLTGGVWVAREREASYYIYVKVTETTPNKRRSDCNTQSFNLQCMRWMFLVWVYHSDEKVPSNTLDDSTTCSSSTILDDNLFL